MKDLRSGSCRPRASHTGAAKPVEPEQGRLWAAIAQATLGADAKGGHECQVIDMIEQSAHRQQPLCEAILI